jgi:DNA-binding MarR family transcriptional regulator
MSTIMATVVDKVKHPSQDAADEIFESIHALMHVFRGQQYRALRDSRHDLTHMDGKVLSFFGRNPGATHGELVAHSARDKGQMGRLISALRDRGLLETRVDDADRRIQRLYLTIDGRTVQSSVQRQRLRVAKLAVADLDDAERQQLLALLRRVRSTLEAVG